MVAKKEQKTEPKKATTPTTENTPEADIDLSNSFTVKAVTILAKGVMLLVWCTFGLAVWIAMVIRTMAATTAVSIVALIGRGSLKRSFATMDYIASIWPRGISQIMNLNMLSDQKDAEEEVSLNADTIKRFAQETAYTIAFFGSIYVLIFGFPDLGLSFPIWSLMTAGQAWITIWIITGVAAAIGYFSSSPLDDSKFGVAIFAGFCAWIITASFLFTFVAETG